MATKAIRGMTVSRLHKLLGKLIAQGEGRRPVCVAKDTFRDNRENDGVTILDVQNVVIRVIPMADDDGGTALDSKGREKTRRTAIVVGNSYSPLTGW